MQRLKKILNPGSNKDDEIMYSDAGANDGKIAGEGSHFSGKPGKEPKSSKSSSKSRKASSSKASVAPAQSAIKSEEEPIQPVPPPTSAAAVAPSKGSSKESSKETTAAAIAPSKGSSKEPTKQDSTPAQPSAAATAAATTAAARSAEQPAKSDTTKTTSTQQPAKSQKSAAEPASFVAASTAGLAPMDNNLDRTRSDVSGSVYSQDPETSPRIAPTSASTGTVQQPSESKPHTARDVATGAGVGAGLAGAAGLASRHDEKPTVEPTTTSSGPAGAVQETPDSNLSPQEREIQNATYTYRSYPLASSPQKNDVQRGGSTAESSQWGAPPASYRHDSTPHVPGEFPEGSSNEIPTMSSFASGTAAPNPSEPSKSYAGAQAPSTIPEDAPLNTSSRSADAQENHSGRNAALAGIGAAGAGGLAASEYARHHGEKEPASTGTSGALPGQTTVTGQSTSEAPTASATRSVPTGATTSTATPVTPEKQTASAAPLRSGTSQSPTPRQDEHHYGRDAALGAGAAGIGAGAYEAAKHHEERGSGSAATNDLPQTSSKGTAFFSGPQGSAVGSQSALADQRAEPTSTHQPGLADAAAGGVPTGEAPSGLGQKARDPTTTQATPSAAPQQQSTKTENDTHHGRDAALAAGGVGAAAGAYGLSKHEKDAKDVQRDAAPTSTVGPTTASASPSAGQTAGAATAPVAATGPTSAAQAKSATAPQVDGAKNKPAEDKKDDHLGRDAAVVGGAAAAGGVAAHELSKKDQEKLDKEKAKEAEKADKQHQKEVHKQEKAQKKEEEKKAKEAKKAEEKKAKEAKKAEEKKAKEDKKKAEKEAAAATAAVEAERERKEKQAKKEEQKHQKEVEKEEKHHQKEIEKEEKQHQKEVEKEEKQHQKEVEKEQHEQRKKHEEEAAAAAAAAAAAEAEHKKHEDAKKKEEADRQKKAQEEQAKLAQEEEKRKSAAAAPVQDKHDQEDKKSKKKHEQEAAAAAAAAEAERKHHEETTKKAEKERQEKLEREQKKQKHEEEKEDKKKNRRSIFGFLHRDKDEKAEEENAKEEKKDDKSHKKEAVAAGVVGAGGAAAAGEAIHKHREGEAANAAEKPAGDSTVHPVGAPRDARVAATSQPSDLTAAHAASSEHLPPGTAAATGTSGVAGTGPSMVDSSTGHPAEPVNDSHDHSRAGPIAAGAAGASALGGAAYAADRHHGSDQPTGQNAGPGTTSTGNGGLHDQQPAVAQAAPGAATGQSTVPQGQNQGVSSTQTGAQPAEEHSKAKPIAAGAAGTAVAGGAAYAAKEHHDKKNQAAAEQKVGDSASPQSQRHSKHDKSDTETDDKSKKRRSFLGGLFHRDHSKDREDKDRKSKSKERAVAGTAAGATGAAAVAEEEKHKSKAADPVAQDHAATDGRAATPLQGDREVGQGEGTPSKHGHGHGSGNQDGVGRHHSKLHKEPPKKVREELEHKAEEIRKSYEGPDATGPGPHVGTDGPIGAAR